MLVLFRALGQHSREYLETCVVMFDADTVTNKHLFGRILVDLGVELLRSGEFERAEELLHQSYGMLLHTAGVSNVHDLWMTSLKARDGKIDGGNVVAVLDTLEQCWHLGILAHRRDGGKLLEAVGDENVALYHVVKVGNQELLDKFLLEGVGDPNYIHPQEGSLLFLSFFHNVQESEVYDALIGQVSSTQCVVTVQTCWKTLIGCQNGKVVQMEKQDDSRVMWILDLEEYTLKTLDRGLYLGVRDNSVELLDEAEVNMMSLMFVFLKVFLFKEWSFGSTINADFLTHQQSDLTLSAVDPINVVLTEYQDKEEEMWITFQYSL